MNPNSKFKVKKKFFWKGVKGWGGGGGGGGGWGGGEVGARVQNLKQKKFFGRGWGKGG